MTRQQLEAAGFIYADYLPHGTRYGEGDVYVLLSPRKTVRVYVPDASDIIEVSTGDLFAPDVHYQGPIRDLEELLRYVQGALQ